MDNTNTLGSRRPRQNQADLIDLSDELEEDTCNTILNQFDPLGKVLDPKQPSGQISRTHSSNQLRKPLELRRRDRRFQTSSSHRLSHSKIESNVSTKKENQLKNSCSTSNMIRATKSSILLSNGPIEASSSPESAIEGGLNKLSLNSGSSSDEQSQSLSSNTDLNKALGQQFFNNNQNDISNELKLSRKHQRSNQELTHLTQNIKSFREQFKHHDKTTNSGIVFSPTLYSSKVRDMSVKIIITSPMASIPVNFTCNVSTTIEHLISHGVCSMFESISEEDSMDNYMIKVTGKDEYFDPKLCLADYAIVSHCWKFDLDVNLTLIKVDSVQRLFLRTSKDDFRCKSLLCPDDLMSRTNILRFSDLNYESLNITIDTFEHEAKRLYHEVTTRSTSVQTQSLLQTAKATCSLLLNCETSQLTESKDNLAELCRSYREEGSQLQDEDRYKMIEVIQNAIKRLLATMHRLLQLTSSSLPVDYEVPDLIQGTSSIDAFVDTPVELLKDHVTIQIQLISQLSPDWLNNYHDFHLEVEIMYGEKQLCSKVSTKVVRVDTSFFPRLLFDEELQFSITYSSLPREARFVLTLYGTETQPIAGSTNQASVMGDESRPVYRTGSSTSIASTTPMYSSSPKNNLVIAGQKVQQEPVQNALATSIAYIFDHKSSLRQGGGLLYMHTLNEIQNRDIYIETLAERRDPVLMIEFMRFPPEKKIYFPLEIQRKCSSSEYRAKLASYDFEQLDSGTKYILNTIIHKKQFHETLMDDERSLLWDNRLYLTKIASALPKVLLSTPSWSSSNLAHIYQLLDCWQPLEAIDAIQLLLPSYPDAYIRKVTTDWIAKQRDDELYDYVPQLLQAFRYEKNLDCPLFWLLMDRALRNIRIANLLYWQLKLNACDKLFQERSEILTNCLLQICGAAFWMSTDRQNELLSKLTNVSSEIKKSRDNYRMAVLHKKLEFVQDYLMERKPTLPWAPSLQVCDVEIRSCSYFPSKTLPLKLAFRSCEESCNKSVKFFTYDTIFKVGDDLRQDMLAIQMIRIMEKLWLREGLDLRMVTFDCLATNEREGMVEMVQNAETLRKIQQNSSLIVGPFNPKAIDNYIRLHNTSELEYKTALDKFLHSCAGYSVATYILGICDRHNDNIMVTNSGHLFHIDFGKFLGDVQMMGSIKRDRTPFVLTADMAYVINGGDKPSKKFQTYIELCTMGFNIIRRHRNLFLNLFSLMSSAKIHGLNSESVKYIDRMLMPNLTEPEAMASFTRLIHECLNSRSTQVNFFIHNLAQLRFSNDNSKQSLLSFVPKTFSITTDGKIESLEIVHLYKKYEPEKNYYYVVRVRRYCQPDATDITRTFREFLELQMKLSCTYSHINFHDITRSTSSYIMEMVGRGNTREIAERRLIELRTFLDRLLALPHEIDECDLIYTFFHPILRDQSISSFDNSFLQESSSSTFGTQEYNEATRNALYLGSNGQVKLSLSYKNSNLSIMIMHAKNLSCPEGSSGPNCYAKTYLLPDQYKQTKRKTGVARQSCHPSFVELIVYKIPIENLKQLTLQVSIWHTEIVQNKVFLGATLIPLGGLDLSKETTAWYPLKGF